MGKIAYRAEGVDTDNPEASLVEAIERAVRLQESAPAAGEE
jgi:hypothetical protein